MITSLGGPHFWKIQLRYVFCLLLTGVGVTTPLQPSLCTVRNQPCQTTQPLLLLPPVTSHHLMERIIPVHQGTPWQRMAFIPVEGFSRFSVHQHHFFGSQRSSSSLWLTPTETEDDVETQHSKSRIRGALQRFPSRLLKLVPFSRVKPHKWRPLRWFRRNKKAEIEHDNSRHMTDVLEANVVDATIVKEEPMMKVEEENAVLAEVVAAPASRKAKSSFGRPKGNRWAVSAPHVDFTGTWTLVNTEEFRKEYDEYLTRLGQPMFVRSVALSIIGLTSEQFKQSDGGRELCIRGQNFRGVWERTLLASAPDHDKDEGEFQPTMVEIVSADSETVLAEAWWENEGTVHRSWIRGVTKYGGGDFESIRYLEDSGKIMVCESTFHPTDEDQPKASVTWRFQRSEK